MAPGLLRAFAQGFRTVSKGWEPAVASIAQKNILGDAATRSMVAEPSGTYNVPAGHKGSDLSDSICNISLQRMRDLTLRQDLKLDGEGGLVPLKDVFQGHRALLVGLPGGKICAEQHLPGFLEKLSNLSGKELDKVICIVPADCKMLNAKREANKGNSQLSFYEDPGNGFARLLGMNRIGEGPPTHRYAGIVENGILLKLAVEKTPKDVDVSSADSILRIWDYLKNKKD